MAPKLKPTPPAFVAKPKPGAKKAAPKKAAEAPVEPPKPSPAIRVTAGPFLDDRATRSYEAWTVITRYGDIIQYHRFRTRDEALNFRKTLTDTPIMERT